MRYLRAICRFTVGIIFILSGFLKAVDPIGNSLKIDEYLKAFHLGFLDFTSVPAGILLSAAEFLIGVCILKGIKMKLFSRVALIFISFFTLLTLYSAIFNPVQDCGCFGEAIHLSNWETFFKNVILLGCAIVIFLQRDQFKPIASAKWNYIYIGGYSALILGISICALLYLPQIDFGVFKAGTDLTTSADAQPEHEYEVVFTYSKDGEEKTFTLENLPDSSWTFVDSQTKLISASSYTDGNTELILKTGDGIYVTNEVLGSGRPLFLLSLYNFSRISAKKMERIAAIRDTLAASGADFYILSGNTPEESEALLPNFDILYTDYKNAISLNRSNGGLTYINDGTVIRKWSSCETPDRFDDVLCEDSEVVTANVVIKEQLFVEITIFVILFMILIIRFFSKIIYSRTK